MALPQPKILTPPPPSGERLCPPYVVVVVDAVVVDDSCSCTVAVEKLHTPLSSHYGVHCYVHIQYIVR